MRRTAAALALVAAVGLASCGGESGPAAAERPTLTVSAAASVKEAFTAYGEQFAPAEARFSFAGSDELAAQLEQGVEPDVYAAANTDLPQRLHEQGLVERPVVFARNRLVLAVQAGEGGPRSLEEAAGDGVTLAVGAPSVPVGAYTREILARLPERTAEAILANVRSNEPDVAGIVGKLTQGAVDAGFVYASDVTGADGRLTAIELPERVQPAVEYGGAVVKGARNAQQARAFLDGLRTGAGREALEAAGLQPAAPP